MHYIFLAVFVLLVVLKIKSIINKIKHGKDVAQNLMAKKEELSKKFDEYNNMSEEDKAQYQKEMLAKNEEACAKKEDGKSKRQISAGSARVIFLVFASLSFLFSYLEIKPAVNLYQKEIANIEYLEKNLGNDIKYISGNVSSDDILEIDAIRTNSALMLQKKVEMYQWVEKTKKSTPSNEKKFKKKWDAKHHKSPISAPLKYKNPKTKNKGKTVYSNSVKINGLSLERAILQKIKAKDAQLKSLDGYVKKGEYFYKKAGSPKVGDERISFLYAPIGQYSVIAPQEGNGLSTYKGTAIIKEGNISAKELFSLYKKEVLINMLKSLGVATLIGAFGMLLLIFAIKIKSLKSKKLGLE